MTSAAHGHRDDTAPRPPDVTIIRDSLPSPVPFSIVASWPFRRRRKMLTTNARAHKAPFLIEHGYRRIINKQSERCAQCTAPFIYMLLAVLPSSLPRQAAYAIY